MNEVAKDVAGGDEEGDKMMMLLMELVSGGIGAFDSKKGDFRGDIQRGECSWGDEEGTKNGDAWYGPEVKIKEGHQAKKIVMWPFWS